MTTDAEILNNPAYADTYGEPFDDTNPDLPTDDEWREFMQAQEEEEARTAHLWDTCEHWNWRTNNTCEDCNRVME